MTTELQKIQDGIHARESSFEGDAYKTWEVTVAWSSGKETVTVRALTGWEALVLGEALLVQWILEGSAAVTDEERHQFDNDREQSRIGCVSYDLYAREVTA